MNYLNPINPQENNMEKFSIKIITSFTGALLILLGLVACNNPNIDSKDSTVQHKADTLIRPLQLDTFFQSSDFIGHFSLLNLNTAEYMVYSDSVFTQAFSPASTFKIFNSMVAFETGVITDTNQTFKWDGKDRGWNKWNRDHNIKSAIQYSALWFFQKIAKQVYEKDSLAYKDFLIKSNYGNQQHGKDIELFWLDNSLQISPQQQLEFLRRMYKNELPFSRETIARTKEVIKIRKYNNDILYGKTGLSKIDDACIGWYIGFVDKGDDVFFFCTNLQNIKKIKSISEFRKTYMSTTMDILNHLNILEI